MLCTIILFIIIINIIFVMIIIIIIIIIIINNGFTHSYNYYCSFLYISSSGISYCLFIYCWFNVVFLTLTEFK